MEKTDKFIKLLHSKYGIDIREDKKHILERQIDKLIKKSNIKTYNDYYDRLKKDITGKYTKELLNHITVNKTHFFREQDHFDFIENRLDFILEKNKDILAKKKIRVWSAASSTGEEAYSLAMLLTEIMPKDIELDILGTDISHRALEVAIAGKYPKTVENNLSKYYLNKYFRKEDGNYIIKNEIKKVVKFREFNLKSNFPFKQKLDIIFCRNVMIYFDEDFIDKLIQKFYNVSKPGTLFCIGHSESIRKKDHKFKYIKPTIYMK